ncbi:MAG: dUTP diphosphatase [Clostridia bacterium]|nr:dUTP diphosphatase [Clostridia bacterium]
MFCKKLKIKFKKLNENAITPTFGSEYAAGADLYSAEEEIVINPNETAFIGTGIACAIPKYAVGLIFARSGLACKKGLAPANKVGVIDSDYRGEIKVALHNHGKEPQTVLKGERVAQMVITNYYPCLYIECDSLDETKRGEGGFGSTGRK